MSENLTQQVIVPAYVWQDETQRQAVAVAAVGGMQASAAQHGLRIVGDVLDDTTVQVMPLKAEVGHAQIGDDEVAFVAYNPTEPALADLIFVMFTAQTEPVS